MENGKLENCRQRVAAFVDYLDIPTTKFERNCGFSNGYLSKLTNLTEDKAEKICTAYPQVSKVWLMTGEGEMIKTGESGMATPTTDHVQIMLQLLEASERRIDKTNEMICRLSDATAAMIKQHGELIGALDKRDEQIIALLASDLRETREMVVKILQQRE